LELPPLDLSASGWPDVGVAPARLDAETSEMVMRAFKVLGEAVREAPEFAAKKRRKGK
jgi:hypothetical protein